MNVQNVVQVSLLIIFASSQCIAMESAALMQGHRIVNEKLCLFSNILEAAHAQPNEVQRAYDLLGAYCEKTPTSQDIIALRERLEQPEALIRRDEELRSNLIVSGDRQALAPLEEFIKEVSSFILKYPQLAAILVPLKKHYEEYLNAFFLPQTNRVDHIRPKALISGEGLVYPLHFTREWWQQLVETRKGITSYRIDQKMALDLVSKDKYDLFKKKNTEGSHAVCFVRTKTAGVHFKGNTTSTGLPVGKEAEVYWLSKLLFDRGMAPTSFVSLHGVEMMKPSEKSVARSAYAMALATGKTSSDFFALDPRYETEFEQVFCSPLVQAGYHIEGMSLENFIKDVQGGKRSYNDLDVSTFTEHFVIGLLTSPSDATPGNIFVNTTVRPHPLVGIDNDMALGPDIVKVGNKHCVEVKNILYCLPLMNMKLSPFTVRKVTTLDPDLVLLMQWPQCMGAQQDAYDILLKTKYSLNREQKPYLMPNDYKRELQLPLKFDPELLLTLRTRLHSIQELVKHNPHMTHWDLFMAVRPLTARFYLKQVTKYWNLGPIDTFINIMHGQKGEEFIEDVIDLAEQITEKDTAASLLANITVGSDSTGRQTATLDDIVKQVIKNTDDMLVRLIQKKAALPVIKFLIERGLDPFVMLAGQRTIVHFAIEQRADISIICYLLDLYEESDKKEVLAEFNKQGETILDSALKMENYDVMKLLMSKGIVNCNPATAMNALQKYLHTNNHQFDFLWSDLLKYNSFIGWIHHVRAVLLQSETQGLPVRAAHFGNCVIPLSIQNQIMDSRGNFLQAVSRGNHKIAFCEHQDLFGNYGTYFKLYPDIPVMEKYMASFILRLVGSGAAYVETIKCDSVPINISQGIVGENLAVVLKDKPEFIDKINQKNLSGLMIVAMLTNPEDGKPEQYILDPKFNLECVDNDHAFVPAVVRDVPKEGKFEAVVQVKTVLFCFDYMKAPIHHEIRKKIIDLDVYSFLKEGLEECKQDTQLIQMLFSESERATLLSKHNCFVGFPFQKGAIAHLLEKFESLKELVIADPRITHIDLLAKLEPRLAQRYRAALQERISVRDRFNLVDGKFYPPNPTGSFTTVTRSGQILQSMNIPLKEKKILFTADDALAELQQAHEEAHLKEYNYAIQLFESGKIPTLLLSTSWARFLRSIDFKRVSSRDQENLLMLLKNIELRDFTLRGCTALSDSWIEKLNFENTVKIDLRDTPITGTSIGTISKKGLFVEELNLGDCVKIKKMGDSKNILIYSRLKALNLSGCSQLERISIHAPSLEYLNIRNCSVLREVAIDNLISGTSLKKIECDSQHSEIVGTILKRYNKVDTEIKVHENTDAHNVDSQSGVPQFKRSTTNGPEGVVSSQQRAGTQLVRSATMDHPNTRNTVDNLTSSSSASSSGLHSKEAQRGNEEAKKRILTSNIQDNRAVGVERNNSNSRSSAVKQSDVQSIVDKALKVREATGSFKTVIKQLIFAAEAGHSEAQYQVGRCYYFGHDAPQNKEAAFELFSKAAGQNNVDAMGLLVKLYGKDHKYDVAFDLVDRLIALAEFKRLCVIAEYFEEEKDRNTAVLIYQKLALANDGRGFFKLACSYELGKGTEKNAHLALENYKKAEQSTDPDILFELGVKYSKGTDSLLADPIKAIELWRKAAHYGHEQAKKKLGKVLKNNSFL